MSSIDISSCNTSSELFTLIKGKSGLSGVKLAEKLNVASQHVSMIINGTRLPSENLLRKLSSCFQVDYHQCIEILNADLAKRDTSKEVKRSRKPIEAQPSSQYQIKEMELLKGNSQLNNLYQQILSLPDEIQEKANGVLEDFIIRELGGVITVEELEQKLRAISLKWQETHPSSYYSASVAEELKGFVEIGNEKVYVEITADKHLVSISTLQKDQHHFKDVCSSVPGWYAEEYSTGNLGTIYKNVSLFHRRLFNMMGLVNEVKTMVSHHDLNAANLTFQEFNLNTYLKGNNEGVEW
jgi:transcriptional regulator with XRE-family HTH domain